MSALPALLKTYAARGNATLASTATLLAKYQSALYLLSQHLLDTATGGTAEGTRTLENTWVCKGSSDGSSFNVAGTNLWDAHTKVVVAAAGVAHSWLWLENAHLGYQIVIDAISSNTTVVIRAAPIAAPFAGGSLTNRPVNAASEFGWNTTSTGDSTSTFLSDTVIGGTDYGHFQTDEDGCFVYFLARAGFGIYPTVVALVAPVVPVAGRSIFWVGNSVNSARGAMSVVAIAGQPSGCVGRTPNGTVVVNIGGMDRLYAGSSDLFGTGASLTDAITGFYNAVACSVWSAVAAQHAHRGVIPDWYMVPPLTVGESITSAGVQQRVIVGDFMIPFPVVVPLN